jgi:hypothetical protein
MVDLVRNAAGLLAEGMEIHGCEDDEALDSGRHI